MKWEFNSSIHPDILIAISDEMRKAIEKHPQWPGDIIHAAAIVNEEAGELTRAALQFTYQEGRIEEVQKEAMQTAVTAIRLLKALMEIEYRPQPTL